MRNLLFAFALLSLLAGCVGGAGDRDGGGRRFGDPQLGRDLGGAVQMAIQGEYIAAGVAAIAGTLAATGRYFFRRGETAEQKKTAEVETRVKKAINGTGSGSAQSGA